MNGLSDNLSMRTFYSPILLLIGFLLVGCGRTREVGPLENLPVTDTIFTDTLPEKPPLPPARDTMRLHINSNYVDSMLIHIPGNRNPRRPMSKADQIRFSERIGRSVYDTVRNESGIQYKMKEPDYTVIIKFKRSDDREPLMIWMESDQIRYRNKWFLMHPERPDKTYVILERYRDKTPEE